MEHYTPIYDLTVLNKNTNNIKYNNNDTVFVCLFQIVNNSLTNVVYKPYLSFLLYKYPSTSSKEHFIFPFNHLSSSCKKLKSVSLESYHLLQLAWCLKPCISQEWRAQMFYGP